MPDPASRLPLAADELAALRDELERARAELRQTADRLRAAQAQTVQAGKLSALGQLVAGVAHEMNNPLSSVLGYAQLVHQEVLRRPELTEQAKDLLPDIGHILAEASRAARIVRNLLLFARRQHVARAYQDVEFLCDQIVELRAHDLRLNGIEVHTSFAPNLPSVFADGSQVQQVLLNLVLNAEQAVRQSPTRRIELHVSAEPLCGAVLIEVRDSGEGIGAESLARVFDPFFTTRAEGEGTGLGLSIAQHIVRDHGGQIWVESDPHERTSFFVRLPASEDQVEPGSRGPVVVLHGDAGIRGPFAAALAGWGFASRSIGTLDEAVSDADLKPVMVLADAGAIRRDPARWDEVRARWGDGCPIIIITSDDARDVAVLRRAQALVGPAADLAELRQALAESQVLAGRT